MKREIHPSYNKIASNNEGGKAVSKKPRKNIKSSLLSF